jgi:hypothetical protein
MLWGRYTGPGAYRTGGETRTRIPRARGTDIRLWSIRKTEGVGGLPVTMGKVGGWTSMPA